MNRTIEDSEPYIVCMSTRREEREFEVISNGEKEANFLDLEISLEDGVLREDNTIISKSGTLRFAQDAYKTLVSSRRDRRTQKALNRNNKGIEK